MPLPRSSRAPLLLLLVGLALAAIAPASDGATPRQRRGAAARAAASKVPVIPVTREPQPASLETVRGLYDAKAAVFVDARSAEDYAAGHMAGAISLPFDEASQHPEKAKTLADHGKPIVTYCEGGDCTLSKDLAFTLIDQGHSRVVYYLDGFPGWKQAGGAIHTGAKP